ncbi:uroporphyrinogen decarboxylase family protein [Desulfitobacterium sp. THU1]|uniref:uroporphyrinogen decarboxylase family protein n=1 Tax=Desulfitobacterium sp. THU1 TaxID=3138072 RepID=UPI00311F5D33
MTKIERVLAMIHGQPVDKLPKGEFHIEDGLITKLLQMTSRESLKGVGFEERRQATELLGLDALVFMADAESQDDPWAELRRWQEESDFFIFALIDGPFQGVGHGYHDFTEFLMDIVKDQDKMDCLVQESIQRSLELGRAAIASGAHGILIADDIAYNHGLYVSPRTMRERFFSYLKELRAELGRCARVATGREMPIFFHSDGDLQLVLRDIKEMGFNGLHSLESVMDMMKVREAVGEDFCLMGGYSLAWFSSGGSDKVDELLKATRPGRYIFGTSAGILDAGLGVREVLEVYGYTDKLI